MTRILEVIQGLEPGGAEIALLRRLRHRSADTDTTILTSVPPPAAVFEQLRQLRTETIAHPMSWLHPSAVESVIRSVDPDVIVSHSPGETTKLLTWRTRIYPPIVVVAHHSLVSDDIRLRRTKEIVLRRLNPRADMHIAVSKPAALGPQCAGGRRVEVQVLGAEISDAAPRDDIWPSDTSVRLMTLSRLVWFKNIEALVDAVAVIAPEMRAARAHLALVGSGSSQQSIAEHITAGGVTDLVSIHPQVDDPAGLLRAADVLVSSSTSEGGPLTLFEASLAGARLLSTPTGVAEDVLPEDHMSFLTAGSSRDELAAGLRVMLQRGAVGAEERFARVDSAAKWDCASTSAQFYSLLSSVIG